VAVTFRVHAQHHARQERVRQSSSAGSRTAGRLGRKHRRQQHRAHGLDRTDAATPTANGMKIASATRHYHVDEQSCFPPKAVMS
jgi:hypothetical protein